MEKPRDKRLRGAKPVRRKRPGEPGILEGRKPDSDLASPRREAPSTGWHREGSCKYKKIPARAGILILASCMSCGDESRRILFLDAMDALSPPPTSCVSDWYLNTDVDSGQSLFRNLNTKNNTAAATGVPFDFTSDLYAEHQYADCEHRCHGLAPASSASTSVKRALPLAA